MAEHRGFRTVAYFVNWAIYGRNHQPQDLPATKLTHILYAFANVRPETGEVYLTDSWSDVEKHYPTDTWNEPTPGPHLYGCLKQLALLKRRNRNLKVLLSVGGWTYSRNFGPGVGTAGGRATFAKSAVAILKDCGFDGIDVDWEYPVDAAEAAAYVELLRAVREGLDVYAAAQGIGRDKFLLTVACPAGSQNYEKLKVREMDKYLDFWNLMAYDYAGSWDSTAGHQASYRKSSSMPGSTPFSTEAALEWYRMQGVQPAKLVVGCPLYGRAFVGTHGGPGGRYDGGVGEGSWEQGVWDWKALPPAGAEVRRDDTAVASWSWEEKTGTMISFDSEEVMARKAELIKAQGLGGVMWWESSGDLKLGKGSAIEGVAGVLGMERLEKLEWRENVVEYWASKYRNMREGFPGE